MANYTGYCNTAAHEEEKTVTLWENVPGATLADGDTIQSVAYNSGNICLPCYITIYDNGGKQLGRYIVSNAVKLPVVGSMSYLYRQESGIDLTGYSFNTNYIPTTVGTIGISPLTPIPNEPLAVFWSESFSDKLEGFDLERSVNGQAWEVIMHDSPMSYSDTVGLEWVTVAYRVAAYDTSGAYGAYRATAAFIVGTPPIPMNVEDDYLNLITSEHIQRPKFMALVETMLKPLEGISILFSTWDDAFNIENSVGKQLDAIGAVVGMSRQLPYISQYGSSILSDDDYRFLIKAKSIINRWDGSRESMMRMWSETFPRTLLLIDDHQDMSADLLISGMRTTDYIEEMIENDLLLPRGEGVRYNYSIIEDKSFSYDYDDPNPPSPDHLYGGYDQWAIWEGSSGPAPGPVTPDDETMIFVDSYDGTGGSGTSSDPYHNWTDAWNQLTTARNVIYVMNEILVTSDLTLNTVVTGAMVKRSSKYSGAIFTVDAGATLYLGNITVDGNKDAFYPYIVCQALIQIQGNGTRVIRYSSVTTGTTLQNNFARYGAAIYQRSNSSGSGSELSIASAQGTLKIVGNRAEFGVIRIGANNTVTLVGNITFDGNTSSEQVHLIGSTSNTFGRTLSFINFSPMFASSLRVEGTTLAFSTAISSDSTIPRILFASGSAKATLGGAYAPSGPTVLECSVPVDQRVLITGTSSYTLTTADFAKFQYANSQWNLSYSTANYGSVILNLVP
jgi:hypothetical protein